MGYLVASSLLAFIVSLISAFEGSSALLRFSGTVDVSGENWDV